MAETKEATRAKGIIRSAQRRRRDGGEEDRYKKKKSVNAEGP